jgi:hypothetical protein
MGRVASGHGLDRIWPWAALRLAMAGWHPAMGWVAFSHNKDIILPSSGHLPAKKLDIFWA